MIKRGLGFIFEHSASYLSLIVLSFIVNLTFAHHPQSADIVPRVIFLLTHLQLILTHAYAFDEDHDKGILMFMAPLGERKFDLFIHKKMLQHTFISSACSSFIGMLVFSLWSHLDLNHIFYWGMMLFVTSLFTIQLSMILAALRLSTKHSGILSLFLIFPLIIPSLIFAQTGFDALIQGVRTLDYFYFNSGMSLITLGIGFIFTPKILKYSLAS